MEKEAIRAMMEEEHKREEEQREKEEIAQLRQEQVSSMFLRLLFIVLLLWPFNFALMLLTCCLSNVLAFHVLHPMNRKVYSALLLIPVTHLLPYHDECWSCVLVSNISAGSQGPASQAL